MVADILSSMVSQLNKRSAFLSCAHQSRLIVSNRRVVTCSEPNHIIAVSTLLNPEFLVTTNAHNCLILSYCSC
jgi:hypothetical protein